MGAAGLVTLTLGRPPFPQERSQNNASALRHCLDRWAWPIMPALSTCWAGLRKLCIKEDLEPAQGAGAGAAYDERASVPQVLLDTWEHTARSASTLSIRQGWGAGSLRGSHQPHRCLQSGRCSFLHTLPQLPGGRSVPAQAPWRQGSAMEPRSGGPSPGPPQVGFLQKGHKEELQAPVGMVGTLGHAPGLSTGSAVAVAKDTRWLPGTEVGT